MVHYRSGSTKQVLEGAALTRFLLEKHGRSWDDVALPGVSLADLDGRIFDEYRHRGVESQRLPPQALNKSDEAVIERLRLRDGTRLKRAGTPSTRAASSPTTTSTGWKPFPYRGQP